MAEPLTFPPRDINYLSCTRKSGTRWWGNRFSGRVYCNLVYSNFISACYFIVEIDTSRSIFIQLCTDRISDRMLRRAAAIEPVCGGSNKPHSTCSRLSLGTRSHNNVFVYETRYTTLYRMIAFFFFKRVFIAIFFFVRFARNSNSSRSIPPIHSSTAVSV